MKTMKTMKIEEILGKNRNKKMKNVGKYHFLVCHKRQFSTIKRLNFTKCIVTR